MLVSPPYDESNVCTWCGGDANIIVPIVPTVVDLFCNATNGWGERRRHGDVRRRAYRAEMDRVV